MAKYLIIANYNSEGAKGLLDKGGSARRAAIEKAVSEEGGSVESFYFGFGKDDAYVIVDLPSNVSAAATALNVSASGRVTARVVVLLTPEEIDQAAKQPVDYTPPGG
jgi:uncharacterized protein with GYD domain